MDYMYMYYTPPTAGGTTGSFAWRLNRKLIEISDGLSHTFFVGEKHVRPDEWGLAAGGDFSIYNDDKFEVPTRIAGIGFPLAGGRTKDIDSGTANTKHNLQFGSYHPGICQFAMGDGRAIVLAVETDPDVLRRLANRADREPVVIDQ